MIRGRAPGGPRRVPSTPPESQIRAVKSIPAPVAEETIAQAVASEETTRAKAFSRIAMFMVALVAIQLPVLGGDPQLRNAAALSMAVMFALSAWGLWRASQPGGLTRTVFRVQGYGLATGMFPVLAYVGFFSPVTVVLSLGIYHLGQSTDRVHAVALPLYITIGWVLGCILIMTGLLEDRSLFSTRGIELYSLTLMVSGVGCAMMLTMLLAAIARGSMREAILQANQALLEAQKRGALLQEAHNQLDRAMRMAIGKPGRHTGAHAGDYQLDEVIGLGAMGEVYAATHTQDGHRAAVKLLHADALLREDMIVRFLREAQVCMRFDHDNLVRVFDVGRMDDGAPYMVMEHLEGDHLSAVLRERGNLPAEEAVALGDALAAGLSHAHEQGVIHRDLKPQNIIRVELEALVSEAEAGVGPSAVGDSPSWKILDFGISKLLDSGGTLTGDGGVLGTPAYMSPEQARGREVDERSDVFSLGSVLYRVLTGRPAFPGADTPRIMFSVAYAMPVQPSGQVPGLGPDVDLVLATALAKEPEDRFATPSELTAALRAALLGTLDDTTRTRGTEVLARRPWGYTPEDSGH
ncbi:MAG: serine/threonine-protein kinase [Myxococcales bacterium]|nr:serine/threonine-protein kinase [Myxococcales bacterium]